jgi:hypothetical protein
VAVSGSMCPCFSYDRWRALRDRAEKVDFQRIADALTLALTIPTDEQMRQGVIKGIKRALWFNGIDLQYLFV